jgi:hypothetical protein
MSYQMDFEDRGKITPDDMVTARMYCCHGYERMVSDVVVSYRSDVMQRLCSVS